jgi:hypothetical protein
MVTSGFSATWYRAFLLPFHPARPLYRIESLHPRRKMMKTTAIQCLFALFLWYSSFGCCYVTAGRTLISSCTLRTVSLRTLVIFYDCSHFELDGALLSKSSDAFRRLVQTPRAKPLLFLDRYQQECEVKVMAELLIKLETSTRIYRLLIFCSRNH